MNSNFLVSLFHVSSNKENIIHMLCPTRPKCCRKFNIDKAYYTILTSQEEVDTGRELIYKIRPVCYGLSKYPGLGSYLSKRSIGMGKPQMQTNFLMV